MLIATPKDLGRFHKTPPYIGKDVQASDGCQKQLQ